MFRELVFRLTVMLLTVPAWLDAQGTMTTVGGRIRNTAGAFLSGARVTLTKTQTHSPRSAVTDDNGVYRIPSVPPGIYAVQVACGGYEKVSRENFAVRDRQSETLNFVMRPKALHSSPATTDSSLGSVKFYDGAELQAAPLTDPTGGGGHSNQPSDASHDYPSSAGASEERMGPSAQGVRTEADFEKSGRALLAQRDFGAAIPWFDRAVRRYPRSAHLHLQLGLALCGAGRYDSGLRQFSEAARLEPDNPRAHVLLAEAEGLARHRQTEITALLRSFGARHPESAESHYASALDSWVCFLAERNARALPQAQAEFEKAIEIDPAFARARLRLGMVYDELHWPERAADQFKQAVRLSPNLAAAHYRLAQDELRTGATEDAREQLNVYRKLVQSRGDGGVLEGILEK